MTKDEVVAFIDQTRRKTGKADSDSSPKAKAKKIPNDLEDRVALQFADRYAEHFRFIAAWGRWMLWNGIQWEHEDTLAAFDKARVLCRNAEDAKAKTVAAVVTLARTDRAIAATEDQWDKTLFAFNTRNCEPTEKNDD